MDIFTYIPIIIGIRNDDFSPLITPKTIRENNKHTLHKRLLISLHNFHSYPCALIFENELYLTRNLADINNNEIKQFITTNTDWDVLVLSEINEPHTDVDGYDIVKKITNNTTLFDSHVYLVSARFMQKVKNNTLSDIQTYMYSLPFLSNVTSNCTSNKYTIGRITDISILRRQELKYRWSEFGI